MFYITFVLSLSAFASSHNIALPPTDAPIGMEGSSASGNEVQYVLTPIQANPDTENDDKANNDKKVPPPHFPLARSSPLFIIATGVQDADSLRQEKYADTARVIEGLIQAKVPSSRIIRVNPFTPERLEKVWDDASKDFKSVPPSSVLLILNVDAKLTYQEDFLIPVPKGEAKEERVAESITELRKRIRISTGNPVSLDTILLSNHAGAIRCTRFPDHLFGVVPKNGYRDRREILHWIRQEHLKRDAFFPMNAREWYDNWNVRGVAIHTYSGSFYCPYPNANGYLGDK